MLFDVAVPDQQGTMRIACCSNACDWETMHD